VSFNDVIAEFISILGNRSHLLTGANNGLVANLVRLGLNYHF